MVEEVDVGAPSDDGDPLLALVDAAQTPPLFTDVRVVLGRVSEKRERGELVQPLVDYLQDPLPSSRLVLEWRGGKVPKALTEAIASIGGAVVDTSPGRKVGEWVAEHLTEAGLKVDSDGRARLVTWVGDEPSRAARPHRSPALHLRARRQAHRRPRSSRSSATTAASRRGSSPTPSIAATGPAPSSCSSA